MKQGTIIPRPSYVPVYQNMSINSLASLTAGFFRSKKSVGPIVDGRVEVCIEGTLYYVDMSHISMLSARTHQFLMCIIREFTRRVLQVSSLNRVEENLEVKFSFTDVAAEFGVTTDTAKNLAVNAAAVLKHMSIKAYWQTRRSRCYEELSVLQSYVLEVDILTRRGTISVMLGKSFARYLTYMPVLWYPSTLLYLLPKKNPSSYVFGYRLVLNLKLNFDKPDRNRLAVARLLSYSTEIPHKTSLNSRYGQLRKRIISPFIRDMDALVSYRILNDWHLEIDGQPVSEEELESITYKLFYKAVVVYKLAGNPELKYHRQKVRKSEKIETAHYRPIDGAYT